MEWLDMLFGNPKVDPVDFPTPTGPQMPGKSPYDFQQDPGGVFNPENAPQPEEDLPWYYGLLGGGEDGGRAKAAMSSRSNSTQAKAPALANVPQQQRERRKDTPLMLPSYVRSLMEM